MCDELLDIVFPHLKPVLVERVFVEGGTVHVTARTPDDRVVDCPDCRMAAHRVHGRYQRHLADTAIAGRPVVIDLLVRRLICDHPACPRRTFVEQIEGLTIRYGRRNTPPAAAVGEDHRSTAGLGGLSAQGIDHSAPGGATGDVQVHHIRALADLAHTG